jgi:hypothetical protein
VIAVTKEVVQLDPRSKIAYQLQYDAYKAKNDTTNLVPALLGYMNSDPTNSALREQVIAEIIGLGKANLAAPIAKQLVAENPGDPQYARTYWLVLRAARNYKESVPAGQAYVALDTAAADSNYFFRQVADLRADSAYARAAEVAAQGIAKYPRSGAASGRQGVDRSSARSRSEDRRRGHARRPGLLRPRRHCLRRVEGEGGRRGRRDLQGA